MNENEYMKLAVLGSKKTKFQEDKAKLEEEIAQIEKQKNAQIADIQKQVDVLNKSILNVDKEMNKSKVVVQKQDEQIAKEKELAQEKQKGNNMPQPLKLPVEEDMGGDAATTTASMDASSQVSGDGAKPGWKHYNKIGSVKKRTPKTTIKEFIEHVWDSYVVEK